MLSVRGGRLPRVGMLRVYLYDDEQKDYTGDYYNDFDDLQDLVDLGYRAPFDVTDGHCVQQDRYNCCDQVDDRVVDQDKGKEKLDELDYQRGDFTRALAPPPYSTPFLLARTGRLTVVKVVRSPEKWYRYKLALPLHRVNRT